MDGGGDEEVVGQELDVLGSEICRGFYDCLVLYQARAEIPVPKYRYKTIILPRFGPDQTSIQWLHSVLITDPDKDLQWIETWLAQIETNPRRIGSRTATWRYPWDRPPKLHYFVQFIYFILCRLTWRQYPLPEGHQARRIQRKKLGKKQSVISGFHDELRQWWNLYHKMLPSPYLLTKKSYRLFTI